MAATKITQTGPSGLILYNNTDLDGTKDAVSAAASTLYQVYVDNSANASAASYVKLWDTASGSVTVGTTAPDEIIYVAGGARVTQTYLTVAAGGKAFATAITAACVTTAGTTGTTNPTSNVIVSILYTT